jgi:hypothetical protein
LILDKNSNEYFSITEINSIENYFKEIEVKLESLKLSNKQLEGLKMKFEEFIEGSKIDKRGKWLDYIIGGLFSAFISMAINPDTAAEIYELVKNGINTIIKNIQ